MSSGTYNKHDWYNEGHRNAIPLNAFNLNGMEDGIDTAHILAANLANAILNEIAAREGADSALQTAINLINSYIMEGTNPDDNQLVNRAFVNSSISTSRATFQGTFDSVAELPTIGVKASDYAYVVIYDPVQPTVAIKYSQYLYNGSIWEWAYDLNNSSFTQAQWDAINSGVSARTLTVLAGKQDTNMRVNTITSSSDNTHYPSAKAVYDLFHSIALYDGEVV